MESTNLPPQPDWLSIKITWPKCGFHVRMWACCAMYVRTAGGGGAVGSSCTCSTCESSSKKGSFRRCNHIQIASSKRWQPTAYGKGQEHERFLSSLAQTWDNFSLSLRGDPVWNTQVSLYGTLGHPSYLRYSESRFPFGHSSCEQRWTSSCFLYWKWVSAVCFRLVVFHCVSQKKCEEQRWLLGWSWSKTTWITCKFPQEDFRLVRQREKKWGRLRGTRWYRLSSSCCMMKVARPWSTVWAPFLHHSPFVCDLTYKEAFRRE